MDRIISLLRREPVRARLYSLTGIVSGYLVSRGVIAPTDADFIAALAAVILVVESARAKVTPSPLTGKHRA